MPTRPPRPCSHSGCSSLQPCATHSGTSDRRFDRKRGKTAERGYGGRHQRWRLVILARDPLCVHCLANGRVEPATVADHKTPLNDGGGWELANGQGLCATCHAQKSVTERGLVGSQPPILLAPPAIPVVLVCGPPGAGKSTYVIQHAEPDDVVIDLDVIKAELSGLALYAAGMEWVGPALRERNRRLQALAKAERGTAWVIVSGPHTRDRYDWAEALRTTRIIVLALSAHLCTTRIRNDYRRVRSTTAWDDLVHAWWDAFKPTGRDTVLRDADLVTSQA